MPPKLKSMLDYPNARKVTLSNVSEYCSLAAFRDQIWGQPLNNVLKSFKVIRDDPPEPDIVTPDEILAITWDIDGDIPMFLSEIFGARACFIRDEYPKMLYEIMKFINRHGGGFAGYRVPADPKSMYSEPKPTLPENPFEGIAIRANPGCRVAGATVMGTPGIGKSFFLLYVLALRLSAGLTTVVDWNQDGFLVFSEEGTFAAQLLNGFGIDDSTSNYLPPGTWFLCDSNTNLHDAETKYAQMCSGTGRFVLQAASPREERLQWSKKVNVHTRLYMKNWRLPEAVAARCLQACLPQSEVHLKSFWRTYMPAARYAYGHAHDTSAYAALMAERMAECSREGVATALAESGVGYLKDGISHQILIIEPDDFDRTKYGFSIPTDTILNDLIEHLTIHDQQASLSLYRVFLSHSGSRTMAGKILEKGVIETFPRGGQWRATLMTMKRLKVPKDKGLKGIGDQSSNGLGPRPLLPQLSRKRKAREPIDDERTAPPPPGKIGRVKWDPIAMTTYMSIGRQGTIFSLDNFPAREDEKYQPQPEYLMAFLPSRDELLSSYPVDSRHEVPNGLANGIYIPKALNFPTCDLFLIDNPQNRAILFQVTVGKSHDVNPKFLDYLKGLGFQHLIYVLVTSKDGGYELVMTEDTRSKITSFYRVEL
ncbi:uncharacterized protein FOMMEDRAFT_139689 [Fomitiporia mediterranea MF3/22]|uniref:uncharacterized protein n=1 Tax=Fomitiporia mediterranea (strain MF3/22) TaxID=694068 RepID=UPI00044086D8|nr:uncharacterized protein FOMMEDRAFT_139689 [Fomitiporia mediterranea MF3/22]EJD05159.1 hypothetical protein FOMMEDRAFT_139689 [Fomitiporia mediterranea MF3/22]